MHKNHIRVSARGLVWRDDELLVAQDTKPTEDEQFYYPLGGGVEFGEHSEDALRREFEEELGVSLINVTYRETYEGLFTFDDNPVHELWRVYEADIAESWPYERDEFSGYEAEFDEKIDCFWKRPTEFSEGRETFYPEQLIPDL
ncbi:NUDIX hydrolase [Haladaptatus pallidirubidus]|uniref:NUDIX hydrolase n=1 Tax=Haladaptatus pallidirubidus TaxID=1008152 RepID=A0AAV3UDS7_9EURY|nr:NUDIX domain-containing protein [Haladaptatus pallidirubidus]